MYLLRHLQFLLMWLLHLQVEDYHYFLMNSSKCYYFSNLYESLGFLLLFFIYGSILFSNSDSSNRKEVFIYLQTYYFAQIPHFHPPPYQFPTHTHKAPNQPQNHLSSLQSEPNMKPDCLILERVISWQ